MKNNPLRYVDPSGYFSEEQFIDWFGENWSDLFNESWITILSAAELGDALVYNLSDNSAMTMIFAVKNGGLVGWDLGSGNFNDRKAMDLMDLQSKSNSRVLSLYRNPNCNLSGGSSQFPPESINLHYDARTFRHITGNAERSSITLPDDWYIGPYESVYTGGYLAGFDIGLSDMLDLGEDAITVGGAILAAEKLAPKAIGRKALAAFGGVYALAVLAVNIAEWSRWDTAYYVTNGTNLPPQPVPIPSSQ